MTRTLEAARIVAGIALFPAFMLAAALFWSVVIGVFQVASVLWPEHGPKQRGRR